MIANSLMLGFQSFKVLCSVNTQAYLVLHVTQI